MYVALTVPCLGALVGDGDPRKNRGHPKPTDANWAQSLESSLLAISRLVDNFSTVPNAGPRKENLENFFSSKEDVP